MSVVRGGDGGIAEGASGRVGGGDGGAAEGASGRVGGGEGRSAECASGGVPGGDGGAAEGASPSVGVGEGRVTECASGGVPGGDGGAAEGASGRFGGGDGAAGASGVGSGGEGGGAPRIQPRAAHDRGVGRPVALVVAGPTAAGKSAIGLAVAERIGGVILSADAMQVYRGMDIGTASPTVEERARVPHFAIDVVEPTEAFSAGDFVGEAERAFATGRPVVVVGGTALYVRALQRGLAAAPPIPQAVREELAALADPHEALRGVDPPLAARLHPNDRQRILRGLEVHAVTGERLSDLQAAHENEPDRVELRGVWLDRDDLDARIDARVLAMIEAGYVDEVRALLERGVPPTARSMRSLGYRHLCDHLLDGLALDEAIRRTQRDTRRFARKQRTWRKHLGLADAGADPVGWLIAASG